jgi:hypothetical protein
MYKSNNIRYLFVISFFVAISDSLSATGSLSPEGIREALDSTESRIHFVPVRFQSYGKFEPQKNLLRIFPRVTESTDLLCR